MFIFVTGVKLETNSTGRDIDPVTVNLSSISKSDVEVTSAQGNGGGSKTV